MADTPTLARTHPAIRTTYRGIQYRSRLEARWAAFFHNIGWEHTYEPFDGHGYIPDFLIHGERPLLIEVKPAATRADYLAPISKIEAGLTEWKGDVLIAGATPFPPTGPTGSWGEWQSAGLLGEKNGEGFARDYDDALWAECRNCRQSAVFHDNKSYACRPCGCHDGDRFNGPYHITYLRGAWADACNDVKWRGR